MYSSTAPTGTKFQIGNKNKMLEEDRRAGVLSWSRFCLN